MIDKKVAEKLKPFTAHGVHYDGINGDQCYGDCPFCGKEGKFYTNHVKLLWDCKVCQAKGGVYSFLSQMSKKNASQMNQELINKICVNRGLPPSAFEGIGLGWNGVAYTLPVRNETGHVQDLRVYRPGSKMMGTSGCKVGLVGLDKLVKNETDIVYLCEGEWDYIAMRWLLKKLNRPEAVVGVPGANTFKQEWSKFFMDKHVRVMYDHDGAGEDGELTVKSKIQGIVKSIQFVHWPSVYPDGFDVRDFVVQEAIKKGKPRTTLTSLLTMLKPITRKKENSKIEAEEVGQNNIAELQNIKPHTLEEVHAVYKKWLMMKTTDPIDVMLASHVSNSFSGEATWLFLVAPPGGSKTEIINGLSKCVDVYLTSSITSKTLISGSVGKDGRDMSLIPKLRDKTLVIKDFTSILGKRDVEKDEIFGDLRDAYDQRCGKTFGNGIVRNYECKFNVIAGVTTDIYSATAQYKSLGERFLNFRIGDNLDHLGEVDICEKAIENYSKEDTMRKEISEVVAGFILAINKKIAEMPNKRIPMSKQMIKKIVALARFGARARAGIQRDMYDHDHVLGKPSAEVATRLSKQLAGLAQRLAIIRGKLEVTEEEFLVLAKVMRDTIPQRTNDILFALWRECPTEDDSIKTQDLVEKINYTPSTVARMLKDLVMLNMVKRVGTNTSREWQVSAYMKELIENSGVYYR